HYGERLAAKLRGQRELTVDDAILRVVALRQRRLLAALEGRGHAAMAPIELRGGADPGADPGARRRREGRLPAALAKARAQPAWARAGDDGDRDEAVAELAEELAAH